MRQPSIGEDASPGSIPDEEGEKGKAGQAGTYLTYSFPLQRTALSFLLVYPRKSFIKQPRPLAAAPGYLGFHAQLVKTALGC